MTPERKDAEAPAVSTPAVPVTGPIDMVSQYISVDVAQVLAQLNIEPEAITAPPAPLFWRMSWPELCNIPTKDPKVIVSPVLVVTRVNILPEIEQIFDDYRGLVYCEAVATPSGDTLSFSHAYTYAETGEVLPLSEWLTKQPPPFLARIAYIETNKAGRHVVKPVPAHL